MATALKKSPITVRRMDFEFQDIPRYWFNDDILVTALFNAMSVTFPEGERFFIETVRAFRDQIASPQLQQEISAFIGQEGMHSKEHDAFNHYLKQMGLDITTIEAYTQKNMDHSRAVCTPEVKLAITCALEHFTAIMAECVLGHPEALDSLHPTMRKLWAWHCIEETEHKAVAYDVFQHVVGDEDMRHRVMLRVTLFFIYRNARNMTHLLYKDGQLFRPSVWYKGIKTLFGKKGLMRGLWPLYREYYQPGFHPWHRDSSAMVDQWKRKLDIDQVKTRAAAHPAATKATCSTADEI